jgi:hypothetical protein
MPLLLFTGCAPRITPPTAVPHPVPVVVADYGRHTSLILPDTGGGLIEFAWGDYPWFARNRTGSGSGIAALFWSEGATLGVRRFPAISDLDHLLFATQADRLMAFPADADRVSALRDRLIADFDRNADSMIFNNQCRMYFVRDADHYWFGHNCNHMTAQWLRDIGCRIDGMVMLSNFELKAAPAASGS